MKKLLISCGILLLAGCGGGTNEGMSPEPSASSSGNFDANGSWNVVSENCASADFANSTGTVGATDGPIQNFSTSTGDVGTLDTTTGDVMLCYEGSLTDCHSACVGMMTNSNTVNLTCEEAGGSGSCDLNIQRE